MTGKRPRMSLTYFCPSCWNEVGPVATCPQCGADPGGFARESYEEKLVRALRHPEPTVPVRAATILGELRSRAAVEPLIDVATRVEDPYIQEAVAEALGRIGDTRARPCLVRLGREGAVRVRAAAGLALKNLSGRQDETKGQDVERRSSFTK